MRKLFLATASVLALGLATSGVSFAAQPGNSARAPATSTPSATMPSTTGQYGTTGQSETTSPSEQGMQATAPEHLSQAQLKQVQQKLKDQGLYKGEIDGQMGPNTKQAVEQFQQKNDLQATG
ncbi:MAG: peptidoglycan-binding domain-containing protein, partial [Stellaceae bacterium]